MKKVSEVPGCASCPMRRLNPNNTFVEPKAGTGRRLVIGEAPGEEEQATGIPFIGGAGRWFDAMCRKAGIQRDELTILNTIQCRPPDNVYPTDSDAKSYITLEEGERAVNQCVKNHVIPLIRSRRWDRIDLLGEKALRYLTGKSEGIFKWRGSPIEVEGVPAMATLHPAAIMRSQEMLPVVVNDLRKSLKQPPENYITHPSLPQVEAFDATEFAFDIETAHWFTGSPAITMVGLSAAPYTAIVVPFTGSYVRELKRIFAKAGAVVGHNAAQFDLPILRDNGVVISEECEVWDTMLMQHLRFPDLPHDLEFVGSQFSSKPAWKAEKKDFELYCARDTDVTMQVYRQLRPMLKSAGLTELYRNVQVPLSRICYLMHKTGFKVDPNQIHSVREKFMQQMLAEEKNLPEYLRTQKVTRQRRIPAPPGTKSAKTGKPLKFVMQDYEDTEVPWRSTDVIEKYLYETLALPKQEDLKTGRVTTGKMALDKLYRRTKDRSLLALRKLRQYNSMLTLFAKEQNAEVGRQHAHFSVHGTSSGRLSSSAPNAQNIPQAARYIYVPSHPGWYIIDVDYSQIENRLTAYFAKDDERMQRFLVDPNFSEHKFAASLFFDIPYADVIKDNDKDAPYGKAKRIVHGSNYGMGAKKISLMYDMDLKETKVLQDKWKQAINKTTLWQSATAEKAKKDGYLTTPFGRKRYFYTTSYFTESLSFLPQSTAADVIFRAMLGLMYERITWPLERVQKVVRYVEPLPRLVQLLLQVHDSLVLECPPELLDETCAILRRVMEQPFAELGGLSIPIGIKYSNESWGQCE